ncbi:MAG: hypothetical protein HQ483_15385 [Rhodospirillales bacterium]|nr:hypothetical protein [Rhodospirillales bacterium]
MSDPATQVHGTCVGIDGIGVLLTGPSGSGKSDLALRLIDQGADLVADDRVDLSVEGDKLVARAPAILCGLLEVRNVGILEFPYIKSIAVQAVVDLAPSRPRERLPADEWIDLAGISLPCFRLDSRSAAAPVKVRLVTGLVSGSIVRTDD